LRTSELGTACTVKPAAASARERLDRHAARGERRAVRRVLHASQRHVDRRIGRDRRERLRKARRDRSREGADHAWSVQLAGRVVAHR